MNRKVLITGIDSFTGQHLSLYLKNYGYDVYGTSLVNSDKKVLTRFAPSPSGDLHLGNARSAILNWIYGKKNNGNFILRIDDTDLERSKEIYINSIKDDLKWLSLDWSLTFKQSETEILFDEINGIALSLNKFLENSSKSFSIFVLFPSSAFCKAKFTRASESSPPSEDIFEIRFDTTG